MARRNRKRALTLGLDAAELDEAECRLAEGEVVRIAARGRVFLCTSVDEVRAAQQGAAVPGAVRLDGAR